jgi:hypothetical protein
MNTDTELSPLDRARAYIVKVDPAVSGQGGRKACLKAAYVAWDFGLSQYGEAWTLLSEYNATCCVPPFTEKELSGQIASAYNGKAQKPFGNKLKKPAAFNYRAPVFRKEKAEPKPVKLPDPEPLPESEISAAETLRVLFEEGETIALILDAKNFGSKTCLDRERLIRQMDAGLLGTNKNNGAYIGLNPIKGKERGNDECAAFRYMLVEFDTFSLDQQWAILRATNLPISAVIFSGNKSLHAWVKLDAENKQDYDAKVKQVFAFNLLREADQKTKDAARLARLPTVAHGDKVQKVIALNIGAESFSEWEKNLPPTEPEEIISEPIPAEPQCRFDCLGYDNDNAIFLPHDLAQVAAIPLNKLSNFAALTRLEPDAKWWAEFFPNEKGGVDYNAAGVWLRERCSAQGVWSDTQSGLRLKGRGVWRDAGHIVVNDGTPFLIVDGKRVNDKWHSPSGFIYTRGDCLPVALDNPLGDTEAASLAHLFEIQTQNKSAGTILAGWTVNGFLVGVLDFRPNVWIAGAAEAGKTHTRGLIAQALGSFCVDVAANTSEPHLRQKLSGVALPFLFDEAESDDKAGQENMQKVLGFVRAGTEKEGQTSGKGSSSGAAVGFKTRTCGLFSSIHHDLTRSRDASRFALIELRRLTEQERTTRNSEARRLQRLTIDTPDFPARLAARAIRYAPYVADNIQKLEDCFIALKVSDREAKKWAALVCGSVCLGFGESEWALTETAANELASGFDFSRFTRTEKDSDAALMRILTHRLPPASAGAIPLTVAELIKIVRADKAAATEGKVLAALGLAFRDNNLLVFIGHNAMLELFKAEPYNGKAERIMAELKQIDPAVKVKRRWLEIRMSAVIIPESALSKYLCNPETDLPEPTNPF